MSHFRIPFLSCLFALVLLTASSARADAPNETFYQSREEISDESLRNIIGIAFISSMTGPDQQPTGDVPLFVAKGEGFEPDGESALKELGPVSGWDYDLQSLRKFPVLEKRGDYLHVVIDVRTNERAWVHLGEEFGEDPRVEFRSFDSKEWAWMGVELFFLSPEGKTRLFGAPRPESRAHPLSPLQPARRNGEVVYEPRILSTHGNFLQLGELISLDDPLAPIGWVPISDENGLLLIWPVFAPMC
ncbi:hypothetical protein [Hyalangium rubrum]|uniref:Lipoprotein n=1 Tax=Hyalangium rubrum TaxID=3103134 RepID=A0ABU5HBX9_9BACT|nr:hypothetical protein [Hyalangium sp. s54d21]MDY7230846.1 hypothetical protein [Hyalangium sp. s54d21]